MAQTNPCSQFLDPVTYSLMRDPVVCNDGHTYDRTTAVKLSVSPFTRAPLLILVDNIDLRSAIHGAYPEMPQSSPQRPAPPLPRIGSLLRSRDGTLNEHRTEANLRYYLEGHGATVALPRINAWIYHHPNSGYAHWLRGVALKALHRQDEALTDLNFVNTRTPSLEATEAIADIELERGKPTVAKALYLKVLESDSSRWESYINLAKAHVALHENAKALELLGTYFSAAPRQHRLQREAENLATALGGGR